MTPHLRIVIMTDSREISGESLGKSTGLYGWPDMLCGFWNSIIKKNDNTIDKYYEKKVELGQNILKIEREKNGF